MRSLCTYVEYVEYLVRSLVSNDLIKKSFSGKYVDKNVSQFLFTRARDKIPALSKNLNFPDDT